MNNACGSGVQKFKVQGCRRLSRKSNPARFPIVPRQYFEFFQVGDDNSYEQLLTD
jgi:hypothetical protein